VNKAAVQAENRVNGSHQRDTGHWIWSAPPAAMAENRKLSTRVMADSFSGPFEPVMAG
jgi:hypothetical protein